MDEPRTVLNEVEVRVLGALIEKEATTPDYYPLSFNALLNACNQKSNRDPVMSLDEAAVRERSKVSMRKACQARQAAPIVALRSMSTGSMRH